jgi:membrane-associated phospholipid phosphatase
MLYQLRRNEPTMAASEIPKPKQSFGRQVLRFMPLLLPAIIFLALVIATWGKRMAPGDIAILDMIHSFAAPMFDPIAVKISEVSDVDPVVIGSFIAIAILWFTRQRYRSIFLALCIVGTAAIGFISKFIFNRARPDLWPGLIHETLNSFPSGHAITSSTIVLCLVIFCWNNRFRIPAMFIGVFYVLSVAISRLYVGVHYPSDILAGWCISCVMVTTLLYLFNWRGWDVTNRQTR